MILHIVIAASLLIAPAVPAAAAVREVGQTELRTLISKGAGQSLSDILLSLGENIGGSPVDVRAFDADGLVYALLLMQPDGRIASVVIDARTGEMLPLRSRRAIDVLTSAQPKSNDDGSDPAAAPQRNAGDPVIYRHLFRNRETDRDRHRSGSKGKKK